MGLLGLFFPILASYQEMCGVFGQKPVTLLEATFSTLVLVRSSFDDFSC